MQKSFAIPVRHNPKYASDIFLTIFTSVLLDFQTYQILKVIFQDVFEALILSYNLISLFSLDLNFFSLLFIWDLTTITLVFIRFPEDVKLNLLNLA